MLSSNHGDLRDIIYKRQWKFRDDREAFLVLHRARRNQHSELVPGRPSWLRTHCPRSGRKISSQTFGRVPHSPCIYPTSVSFDQRDKVSEALITFLCSSQRRRKVALRAPNAGPGREGGWSAEGNAGVHQFGILLDGDYRPLYHLQRTRKGTYDQGEMAGIQVRSCQCHLFQLSLPLSGFRWASTDVP